MNNPLLARWTGPQGGVPPFDAVAVEHFVPAVEAAMAEQRSNLADLCANPAPPTFENTLAALERSGRSFERVMACFGLWSSALGTPEFQTVELELAPKLAAHQDEITQNEKLLARISAVEVAGLSPEQQRLVWLYRTNFVRAGAKLGTLAKRQVCTINERLATLYAAFSQNVLGDESSLTLIEHEHDLAGLTPSLCAAAADEAAAKGYPGKWAIANTRSSVEPFLGSAENRELRQRVWQAFVSRGDHGDARDNKQLIAEILALRATRAGLLGYQSHAHWRVEDSMAKTPECAMALLEAVWPAAVARVREEVADMQAIADADAKAAPASAAIEIAPWDYRYYAEKVRQAKYDLDEKEVKPYLQLETLREGLFWVAGQLLGLHFSPAADVPVYHPDVRVWRVDDGAGKQVGLWYFDPYARAGKQSGAWMSAYRNQERFDGEVTTLVSNNANFVKGKPGAPVLVSWEDATTLFHEFGHALHGLSSSVSYPSLSGTSVARDYVEFPSQLLERWLATPELLSRFARHVDTGQPLPAVLVAKIERAATFNQGFSTVEYLAAALVDLKAHLAVPAPPDPAAFERETLKALGMPTEIVMRHRLPHFGHVFASDGYSAGYYSYLWADTLSADAYEAFLEGRGPYDSEVAARLRRAVLSVGNTVDPAEGYRSFRGRDAGTAALLRKRGFAVPAKLPAAVGNDRPQGSLTHGD